MKKRTISTEEARDVLERVSINTGVSVNDILGDSHLRFIARARQRAYVALRDRGCSYPSIGRLMQRDHSTVISGVRKLQSEMAA